jgi:hypothetical protein
MKLIALMLLAASSTSVDLVDEVFQIEPSKWNFVEVNLRQKPATVNASFRVQAGSEKVRLALMTHDSVELLYEDLPHGVLAVTEPGARGAFRFRVRQPGDYVVVMDNRASKALPASVHLQVSLDFGAADIPVTTGLSRQRQLAVIGLSFLMFFGVVTYAARKLMGAIKRS